MFFKISKQTESNYPYHKQMANGAYFNCDLGWTTHTIADHIVYFKGYVLEDQTVEQIIENSVVDPTPRYKGNFFIIICDNTTTTITHNVCRCSPLQYVNQQCVTNLEKDFSGVWADQYIQISSDLEVTRIKGFQPYIATYDDLEYTDALNQIHAILNNAFEIFLSKNTRPLKVFVTGGIDSLTLYTYLKSFTKNFELVNYNFHKFTEFYIKNIFAIRDHWGYINSHSWGEEPTALLTGGCGDEYFLRGPITLNAIAQHHEIDVLELTKQDPNCYHHKYYLRDKNVKCFGKLDFDVTDKKTVIDWILNTLANDHQHWHLDETIFFSPFQDIRIPNIILNMPKQNIIDHVMNLQINKDLIAMIDPDNLKLLGRYKNSASYTSEYLKLVLPDML
jgi:hypothetical protein